MAESTGPLKGNHRFLKRGCRIVDIGKLIDNCEFIQGMKENRKST